MLSANKNINSVVIDKDSKFLFDDNDDIPLIII